jgi:hypothetical protein
MPRLPDFSVVVWLRKTDKFAALKTEVLDAAVAEPYESTEYQGMVGFAGLPSSLEHIRAGKLRPLAVATATRLEALPDIPTVGDFVPGYEASGWTGIGVPTNTPADIVDKINNAINAGLADSKIKARLADLGHRGCASARRVQKIHRQRNREMGEGGEVFGREAGVTS